MNHINTQSGSKQELRKFGFIMGGMIALVFGLLFPWLGDKTTQTWPIWPFIITAVFWVLALVVPQLLEPVNTIWLKFGNIMGWINSRIILGAMFYLVIFPIGLILKLLGKDGMNRKWKKESKTYRRIVKPRDKSHLEKPF